MRNDCRFELSTPRIAPRLLSEILRHLVRRAFSKSPHSELAARGWKQLFRVLWRLSMQHSVVSKTARSNSCELFTVVQLLMLSLRAVSSSTAHVWWCCHSDRHDVPFLHDEPRIHKTAGNRNRLMPPSTSRPSSPSLITCSYGETIREEVLELAAKAVIAPQPAIHHERSISQRQDAHQF